MNGGSSMPSLSSALQDKEAVIKEQTPWKDLDADGKAERTRKKLKQSIQMLTVQLQSLQQELRGELAIIKAHKHDKDGNAVVENKLNDYGMKTYEMAGNGPSNKYGPTQGEMAEDPFF